MLGLFTFSPTFVGGGLLSLDLVDVRESTVLKNTSEIYIYFFSHKEVEIDKIRICDSRVHKITFISKMDWLDE